MSWGTSCGKYASKIKNKKTLSEKPRESESQKKVLS